MLKFSKGNWNQRRGSLYLGRADACSFSSGSAEWGVVVPGEGWRLLRQRPRSCLPRLAAYEFPSGLMERVRSAA